MEKLLIVDDEEIELDGMAELIDWPSYGYELVGTAINGKRGLALIQEKQPDIVITDIKMPVMDGLAMIRAAQEQHVDTVFVVLSGYGDYEYTSQAMQLGIRHYILKPCDEAKILPVLEQARAELHERRSKAQKTTEMENTVRRMAPMAREKALRDLLLGRETLTHLPGIADDLGGLDRKLLLLLLHTKEGIDHLEQYAITNMMAELLPEGGLLGDTSVSQDVCLLVDAGLYDQLPPAVERLCDEFADGYRQRARHGGADGRTVRAGTPPAGRRTGKYADPAGTPERRAARRRPPDELRYAAQCGQLCGALLCLL